MKELNDIIKNAKNLEEIQNYLIAHYYEHNNLLISFAYRYLFNTTTQELALEDHPIIALLENENLTKQGKNKILKNLIKLGIANIRINITKQVKKNILNYLISSSLTLNIPYDLLYNSLPATMELELKERILALLTSNLPAQIKKTILNNISSSLPTLVESNPSFDLYNDFIKIILNNSLKKDLNILLEELDSEGQTLLARAVEDNNCNITEILLGWGANPHIYMCDINNIIKELQIKISANLLKEEASELLAKLNKKDKENLDQAIKDEDIEHVKQLLQRYNKNNDSEEYIVQLFKHIKDIKYLEDLTARVQYSLLSEAIYNKNNKIIKLLIEAQKDHISSNDIKLLWDYILANYNNDNILQLCEEIGITKQAVIMKEINQQHPSLLRGLLNNYDKQKAAKDSQQLINKFFIYCTSMELESFKQSATTDAKELIDQFIEKHKNDATQLMALLMNKNPMLKDIIRLLDEEIWPNYQIEGNTILHISAFKNHIAIVKILLAKGANLNIKNDIGKTPLHLASRNNNIAIVKILLAKGAELDLQDEIGSTALYLAAKHGHIIILQMLLAKGANPNIKNKNGYTALHLAAINNHTSIITELLAQKNINLNLKNNSVNTALHEAIMKGNREIIKILLQKDLALNDTNEYGYTALHLASFLDDKKTVQQLLTKNVDLTITNNIGYTALHSVVEANNIEMAHLLLAKDTNHINLQNNEGDTALHISAFEGHITMLQILLQKGANPNIMNNKGQTPLHVTREKNYNIITELLSPPTLLNIDISLEEDLAGAERSCTIL